MSHAHPGDQGAASSDCPVLGCTGKQEVDGLCLAHNVMSFGRRQTIDKVFTAAEEGTKVLCDRAGCTEMAAGFDLFCDGHTDERDVVWVSARRCLAVFNALYTTEGRLNLTLRKEKKRRQEVLVVYIEDWSGGWEQRLDDFVVWYSDGGNKPGSFETDHMDESSRGLANALVKAFPGTRGQLIASQLDQAFAEALGKANWWRGSLPAKPRVEELGAVVVLGAKRKAEDLELMLIDEAEEKQIKQNAKTLKAVEKIVKEEVKRMSKKAV